METVTRPHAGRLVAWARQRPEVVVLSADLTSSCEADDFREAYPDRFFSMGMAEQNMMGYAAGLAREGFVPFVHTFAVFITRRPFDQVAMSIAYPNLRVRLLGFVPGVTTPGGVTHQAMDDLALMRATPNMTVLECGDATDVLSILDVMDQVDGPVYVRMLRGAVPRRFPADEPMVLGRARVLGRGGDLTLLTSGVCTAEGLRAAAALRCRGVALSHLHVSTIKPFDDEAVLEALTGPGRGVITLENHSVIGGLGAAVAELMTDHGVGQRLVRLGMQDTYAHGASAAHLMREYGLDARAVIAAVEDLLDTKLDITEDDLPTEVEVEGAREAKAEDL